VLYEEHEVGVAAIFDHAEDEAPTFDCLGQHAITSAISHIAEAHDKHRQCR
jgi:hypothetical protein